MQRFRPRLFHRSKLPLIAIIALALCNVAFSSKPDMIDALLGGVAQAQTRPAVQPISANDISWLFPAPTRAEDLSKIISMRDLTAQNAQDPAKRDRIWSDDAFRQFLGIATSDAGQAGSSSRIGLPAEVQSIDAWHIAGVRIDPGAPGLSAAIRDQFGQSPQIRLIVQPVIRDASGAPVIQDFAAHLIFTFAAGKQPPAQDGCSERPVPDLVAFRKIVDDIVALRAKLAAGQLGSGRVTTSGNMGVHPGLKNAGTVAAVRGEMKTILERHLSPARLTAMAIMGLPAGAPAPWIFLSMTFVPAGLLPSLPNGGFIPVHGPTLDGQQFAQALTPVGSSPRVVPAPHTNNLAPATCQHAALRVPGPAVADRRGSSTSELFATPAPPSSKVRSVLDVVADPGKSHFFNTDCVSCHTDTRRGMEMLNIRSVAGIEPGVLPNGPWNVRNFGWSPPIEGPPQGTVTRRAATETAEGVKFINDMLAR
jgi:hypothetical protein